MTRLTKLIDGNDLEEFNSTFKKIIEFSNDELDKIDNDVNYRFEKCLNYNLLGGKKFRGLILVRCFKELNKNLTSEQLEQAIILGWCVELFQSFFLIHDDLMDGSVTRRGQLCWFRKNDVGLIAINDAIYLQNLNFIILKKKFFHSECYLELVELFLNMYQNTVIGQCLDLILKPPENVEINFDMFTIDSYKKIITYKTAYYSFSLPIRAALYLSGIKDSQVHMQVENCMIKIGQLFQIQDDFFDFYGDSNIIGKIGTDIIEGKCCWLIIMALQMANEKQLEIINENYGKNEPNCVNKIRQLYEQLRLKQLFFNLEENSYRQLNKMIIDLSKEINLPVSAFDFCLNCIYKRIK